MSQRAILLERLGEAAVQRTADLVEAGISMRAMREAVEAGEIVRICPGIVATLDASVAMYVDYVAIHMLSGGVIYGPTAAQIHELADTLDKHTHVIVPHEVTKPMPYYPIKTLRTRRQEVLTVGVVDVETDFGMTFKATGMARTVIDLYDAPGQEQHAVDALAKYVDLGLDTAEIHSIAEKFGMAAEMRARLEMVSFFRDKGMVPR